MIIFPRLLQRNIKGTDQMIRIALGLATALLLAACAYTAPQEAAVPKNPMTSGIGHPASDYPGPRAY